MTASTHVHRSTAYVKAITERGGPGSLTRSRSNSGSSFGWPMPAI